MTCEPDDQLIARAKEVIAHSQPTRTRVEGILERLRAQSQAADELIWEGLSGL